MDRFDSQRDVQNLHQGASQPAGTKTWREAAQAAEGRDLEPKSRRGTTRSAVVRAAVAGRGEQSVLARGGSAHSVTGRSRRTDSVSDRLGRATVDVRGAHATVGGYGRV